ncbi:hypothetical protein [Salinicola avicenniae]|uniref:hypothetical protein n=1 Tax=Salinicola avicenniae TaxID=2916836 RepID=UPI002073D79C|nr:MULTISPECIES: hypothetical protein [unclassified Salinicola]
MAAYEEDTYRPRTLNLLIGVTLATIVIALWYLLDYYYLRESEARVTWYPPAQGCVLEEGCRAGLGVAAAMHFAMREAPAGAGQLTFDVDVQGFEAKQVRIEFVGREMDVRSRAFTLDAQGDGHFIGHGDLGACSSHVDAWRVQVAIESDHGLKGSWFDFDSAQFPAAVSRRDSRREAIDGCLWRNA